MKAGACGGRPDGGDAGKHPARPERDIEAEDAAEHVQGLMTIFQAGLSARY